MRKLAMSVLLLAVAMPHASAQRRMAPSGFVSSRPTAHSRPFPYTLPFFSDYFDSGYSVAPQAAVIVLQSPPANREPEPAPTPANPLLIELKGGRYIRVSGEESAGEETAGQEPGSTPKPDGSSAPAIPSRDLAPVVLVFRDGHREEVASYTIADSALYSQGNFYTDGSWNRKIDLSSLNIPETIEASRSRGVDFRLPAAPNEVITRP